MMSGRQKLEDVSKNIIIKFQSTVVCLSRKLCFKRSTDLIVTTDEEKRIIKSKSTVVCLYHKVCFKKSTDLIVTSNEEKHRGKSRAV